LLLDDDSSAEKLSLKERLNDYSSSFSIHGLSRTIHTDSLFERLFWIASLLVAISLAFLMVRSILTKFSKSDVYINSETKISTQNYFPAVTFCLENIAWKTEYCDLVSNNKLRGYQDPTQPSCNQRDWWKRRIPKQKNFFLQNSFVNRVSLVTVPYFTFEVGCPLEIERDGSCLNKDISEDNFTPFDENKKCITWNWQGKLHNINNRYNFQFAIVNLKYKDKKSVIAYVHDHRESPLLHGFAIPLSPKQDTQLIFQKTVKKRINRSAPHNCESKYYNNSRNIFPGRYTVESCLDTYMCIEALKMCGETFDYCRDFVPEKILDTYWRNNQTRLNVYRCLNNGFGNGSFVGSSSHCVSPCENVKYFTSTMATPGNFKVSMMFKEKNVYQYEEEQTVYTWEDFIAGIGGMIGLFCGFSILSLAELIVFLVLACASMFKRKSRTNQTVEIVLENKNSNENAA